MLKGMPPACDLERLIQVMPLAIIAMVGLSLDALRITTSLPPRVVKSIITYAGGLLALDGKQTANKIAKYLGGFSHDHLTRMLAGERWHCSMLLLSFVKLIGCLGQGFLIIDDTLIHHPRSKKIEGVYWDWDHSLQRNVFGQRLVLLLWTNGSLRIPVGFAFWHKKGARKKYRTKNEIARLLLKWAVHQGIKPDYIAFDNWYASKETFRFIVQELNLSFVTRIKKNYHMVYNGKRLQARTIGRRILKQCRPYRFEKLGRVWARKAEVQVGDCGTMIFCVVKDDIDGNQSGYKYLLASAPRLSAREIVLRYKRRWTIEMYFRDLKQHIGLTHYQGRSLAGTERHVALTFLATLVVDYYRCGTSFSFEEVLMIIQRLVFVNDGKKNLRLATLIPFPLESLRQLDKAKQIIRSQLEKISNLTLQEVPDLTA